MIGIYKITNPYNQIYIGQSKDIERRFEEHKSVGGSNAHLSLSMAKHGIDSHTFEVIEECNIEDLILRERFFIEHYKKDFVLFNYTIYWRYNHKLLIHDKNYGITIMRGLKLVNKLKKQSKFNKKLNQPAK